MTDRRLGIEVDVQQRGDGFKRLEKGTKEWNDALQALDATFANITDELNRVTNRQQEMTDSFERSEIRMRRFSDELEQATSRLKKIGKPYKQLRREAEETEEANEGVARAFHEIAQRAEKINNVIRPINTLRFHSTQLAEAAGLIDKKYDGATQSTQAFEKIADRLDLTISSLEKTIGRMTVGIESLNTNLDRQHKKATAVGETYDVLGTEIHDAGEKAYYLNEALFESSQQLEVWKNKAEIARLQTEAMRHELQQTGTETDEFDSSLTRVGHQLERVAEQLEESKRETNQFDDQMDQLGGSLDRVGDKLDKISKNTESTANSLQKSQLKAEAYAEVFGNIVSDALEEAAQAAVEFGKESVEAFYDFDRGAREIFTLLPGASANMREQLQRDVLLLGTEIGRLPEEMLPAVYDALSAGIPEDNVLDTVAIASEAARAGVADLSSTLKLGVAVLNAQVTGVNDINDVYDQLFFTVKNGVVTMPELTDVMSQVTSIAGEAGVSMQDISSAMIVMTRQGDSAAEAAELLSTMLTQLSTSGTAMASVFEQAAGQSFRSFIAEGHSLADAMQILQDHADRTGQSLGDILGGGSPFFRDTQAARGALELTGKHLDELTQFSNEAQNAMGSMAIASAEMGQAAEQSALEAKAAWEEFKISVGEAGATLFEPLIKNATQFTKVISGNYENGVSRQVDELIESGLSYEQVATRLTKVLNEQNNITGHVTGGYSAVAEQVKRVAAVTGDYSKGSKELEASLQAVFGKQIEVINGYVYLNGQWIDTAENLAKLNELHQETGELLPVEQVKDYAAAAESSDRVLIGLTSTVQANAEVQDVLNEKIDRSAKLRSAETEATQNQAFFLHELIAVKHAEAEATQKRVEAAEAERAKIEEIQQAYSNYAVGASEAEFATTNWTDELFQASAQMGLTQEQIVLMAAATGEYSDEQVEAMLKTAAMKVAVDQLAQGLANGEITTQQAIESIRDFEAQLDKNYKLEFDYDDVKNAETSAKAARDAFLRAEGTYKATFTTHNITINEVKEKKTSSNGDPATPLHSGGSFRAGELLLVGDGPGGKFIPGVSEYVVFDKPGTVIGAAESAHLYKNQQLPPGIGGSSTAVNSIGQPLPEKSSVNIQITIIAQPGQSIVDVTEDTMMEAARKAGLLP